jgi:hypothetical protein
MTTIPDLPAIVDRWIRLGRPLVGARIAVEARCCGEAVRRYLRARGLLGPPRVVRQPPRTPGTPRDGESWLPTPDEIKAEAARIKAEAFSGNAGRIRNYGVKLEPRTPRIHRISRYPI